MSKTEPPAPVTHQALVGTLIIKGLPEDVAVWVADTYLGMAWQEFGAGHSSDVLTEILRNAANRIDAEDLPQTAEDTANFCDGARWATAQLRQIADESGAGPADDATPDWLVDLARRYAPVALSPTERTMLRYALGQAQERIWSEDGFTDENQAAVDSLRCLATGPVVAYRNPFRPGVLLCREHGDGWVGLVPLASDDLPDGGVCTYGDPADPSDMCGRDVLIPQGGQPS